MKATEKEYRFNIRTTEKEKKRLNQFAKKIGVSQSDIIREAIADKIADLDAKIQSGQTVSLGLVVK
jgi:predicted DNA-binding protein